MHGIFLLMISISCRDEFIGIDFMCTNSRCVYEYVHVFRYNVWCIYALMMIIAVGLCNHEYM